MRLQKRIVWDLLVVLALGATVRQGRVSWHEAQTKRGRFLSVEVAQFGAPPPAPMPRPEAATAVEYVDIATMDLFSQDRSPNVIIDRPKAEEPKKMPPLPIFFGVLGLPSGTKALMAEKAGLPSVSVRTGDAVGEFRIASLDTQNVTFAWEGNMISRSINDMINQSNEGVPTSVQSARMPSSLMVAPSSPPPDESPSERSQLPCVSGDNSPVGTVAGRYKKSLERTTRGAVCSWERVK
jgi:hypothetical protein